LGSSQTIIDLLNSKIVGIYDQSTSLINYESLDHKPSIRLPKILQYVVIYVSQSILIQDL